MLNPEKTSFNKEYFKNMTYNEFENYWKEHKFIGDPKKYHKKVCGITKAKSEPKPKGE